MTAVNHVQTVSIKHQRYVHLQVVAMALLTGWILLNMTIPLATPQSFSTSPNQESERNANNDLKQLAQANNQFGFDLYKELGSQKGNLFYSPASISTALSMLFRGTDGETKQEMTGVLHIEMPDDRHHQANGELVQLLNTPSTGFELKVANRLWGQKDFVFMGDYLEDLQNQYQAPMGLVDFESDAEAAREQINAWVLDTTKNRIQELFPRGALDDATRLVLVNAIYFKADWATPFPKTATKDEPFHVANQQKIQVPMMNLEGKFGYAQIDDLQLLSLPYAGDETSMIVLLPDESIDMETFEAKVNSEQVAKWLEQIRPKQTKVALPKFTFDSEFVLTDTLQSLGMKRAFTDRAELNRMSTHDSLYVSTVVHKAFIEVNEEGTEAAAATGIVVGITSAPVVEQAVEFRADRPFLFMIRHNPSGLVLFAGRLDDPR